MTSVRRTPLLVPLALLVFVGSALTGCSATEAASSHPSPTKPGSSTAEASDSADICTWVSAAAAQAALRLQPALTQQAAGTFVDGEPECGFTTDDQSIIINVTVFDASTKPFDPAKPIMGDDAFHPISGVGDRAAIGDFELDAAVGSKVLVVENFTDDSAVAPAQLIALAKLFVPHIR